MSLEVLLNNRANEFVEIVNTLEIRTDKPNWKNVVMQFHNCLQKWSNVN